MTPIRYRATGCVRELGIIEFEKQAWLAEVLANPGGRTSRGILGGGLMGIFRK